MGIFHGLGKCLARANSNGRNTVCIKCCGMAKSDLCHSFTVAVADCNSNNNIPATAAYAVTANGNAIYCRRNSMDVPDL